MSFWNPPPGAAPHSYQFAAPWTQLKKPPVSNNPISKVKAMPVKATVQGIQQVKSALAPQPPVAVTASQVPKLLQFGPAPAAGQSMAPVTPMPSPHKPIGSSVGGVPRMLMNPSAVNRVGGKEMQQNFGPLFPGAAASSPAAAPTKTKAPTAAPFVQPKKQFSQDIRNVTNQALNGQQQSTGFPWMGTLGGAGVGALLGHLGHGMFRGKEDEDGKGDSTGSMMAALGGAGVGGGLGYLGSDPGVQKQIADLLKLSSASSIKQAAVAAARIGEPTLRVAPAVRRALVKVAAARLSSGSRSV